MRSRKFIKATESFIETGSHLGDGIQLAIDSGFNEIYSIELAEKYYSHCKERYKDDPNIKLVLGDSAFELKTILDQNPNKKFTYWLDGHYSGQDTALGIKNCPLVEELFAILSRGIDGELIYIDDMRVYRENHPDVSLETILTMINQFKPNAKYWFEPSEWDSEDYLIVEY